MLVTTTMGRLRQRSRSHPPTTKKPRPGHRRALLRAASQASARGKVKACEASRLREEAPPMPHNGRLQIQVSDSGLRDSVYRSANCASRAAREALQSILRHPLAAPFTGAPADDAQLRRMDGRHPRETPTNIKEKLPGRDTFFLRQLYPMLPASRREPRTRYVDIRGRHKLSEARHHGP